MKVLLINGSPKEKGNTALALREMEKVFLEEGVEVMYLHVGNKPQSGLILTARGRGDAAVNIAFVIYLGIRNAERQKLLNKYVRKIELTGTGGTGLAIGIRGSIYLSVSYKSFISAHMLHFLLHFVCS